MWGMMPSEFLREYEEQDRVGCRNGAYQGDDYWEGERYADIAIHDKVKWRERIVKRIDKIKRLREQYNKAKQYKYHHQMRMYAEDIEKLKEEIRTIVYSRDYIF